MTMRPFDERTTTPPPPPQTPKCHWDTRTVLVPQSITEDYVQMQTKVVAIAIPRAMQK